MLNFFAAVPPYDYTENYVAWEARDNWKAVYDLVHDAGMADDIIWNGQVRAAPVAILLSHTTDMYEQAAGSSLYVITSPLEMTGIFQQRPVETSEPLIDAAVIEAPQGLAVPLANFSGRPVPSLKVTIRDVPEFKSIESVRRGTLTIQREGKDIKIQLPLDWADMIVIRR